MRSLAVVGGGLVGVTAALLAAGRGARVTVFEARPDLWLGASATNEGKIHLGPVFALGDRRTHDVMLRGATSFAPLLERAYDGPLPWDALGTDPFTYLVMPDSLAGPDELAARYRSLDETLRAMKAPTYLGRPLERLVDPVVRTDAVTGLPSFATSERAVDPLRLGALLVDRLRAHPRVTVRTSCRVTRVDEDGLVHHGAGSDRFDATLGCAWDQQETLVPPPHRVARNFRVKCALRLPRCSGPATTATLVQGPYGDVVTHRDYVYASWYPAARLTNEHGLVPSAHAQRLLVGAPERIDLVVDQLKPLQELGLLPGHRADAQETQVIAGVIAGHGVLDISEPTSALHRRGEFGAEVHGSVIVARNFKLTTAPLAALAAVDLALGA